MMLVIMMIIIMVLRVIRTIIHDREERHKNVIPSLFAR